MVIYTPAELVLKGITLSPLQTTVELDGITYHRGQAVALSYQALAEQMCQDYKAEGYACFIVSADQMLTIWRSEKLAQLQPNRDASQDQLSSQEEGKTASPAKSKLIYRGVPVDTTVPDLAQGEAKPVQFSEKKRVYRGVKY